MAYNHFDYVPSGISKSRSVFKYEKAIAMGIEIGYLYPICKPVYMMPGSSLKLDLAAEFRSGALIAPLQDSFVADFTAFKIPLRIVWEHWKQFLGSVDDVLFDYRTQYQIPSFIYGGFISISGVADAYLASHMLACCFELPALLNRSAYTGEADLRISALPFRMYNFVWNEFFRPEQLVSPLLWSKTDNGWTGVNMEYTTIPTSFNNITINRVVPNPTIAGDIVKSGGVVLPTFRVHKSLWTSCLPKPSLETLNLLGDLSAPVGVVPSATATSTGTIAAFYDSGTSFVDGEFKQMVSSGSLSGVTSKPIIADLSQAILTVNNYRETIMLQNYYDALNRAGSRYDEIIRSIFHTQTNFGVIDIPELIVHKRFTIFRKDVVATATTLNSSNAVVTPVGNQASYIDTVVKDSFFTTSTTEHSGVLMLLTVRPSCIRMAQGVEPEWTKLNQFDLYYPQFDGMGDVARLKREIYLASTAVSGDMTSIFGYQEYGAEYKYQRNSATGWCDPYCSGHIPGLTLTEKLSAQPALVANLDGSGSYISCLVEEEAFARCLAISSPEVAPQFIVDIRLTGEIVHPMPVYNIPGMGDLI